MARVLKNKYSSTGERCVNACLNYGELRYLNDDGSPVKIEIPCDKYDEAIIDFEDRLREEIVQSDIEPKKILKRGSVTYNQAKEIATDGSIRGLDFFEIDASVECQHVLGISGGIEYALAIWNGESKEVALKRALVRSIKVYGEDFIDGLNLDDNVDLDLYTRVAKKVYNADNIIDIELYKMRSYAIDSEMCIDALNIKQKIMRNMDLILGVVGSLVGLSLIQIITNFGNNIEDKTAYICLIILGMVTLGLVVKKSTKFIGDKYIKRGTSSIVEMFNEEIERVVYENLLTEKEVKLILTNITNGEISKLLLDMKGSVNKKISINTIVAKESKFAIDTRRIVTLPSEYEIKEALDKFVGKYQEKVLN